MLQKMIDLRSDTVTKPTPAMRRAMAEAEVGDDVYGEDPTVNRLQERAAEIFEKEAALFVPTGSMGNQTAVKLHTRPGQEVIIEERGHIYNFEMATMSAFSGALARPVHSNDGSGILTWDEIAGAIHHHTAYYVAPTGLIALENSHNLAGGSVLTRNRTEDICTRAHEKNLPVHLDGARIFNAAVALNESVADLARPADSVMFCLSKGLGAPVRSALNFASALCWHLASARQFAWSRISTYRAPILKQPCENCEPCWLANYLPQRAQRRIRNTKTRDLVPMPKAFSLCPLWLLI